MNPMDMLQQWLSAVVSRLDLILAAERDVAKEIRLLKLEFREEKERLEGKKT